MIFLCAEFACYSILYRHIDNHDKEMLHSAVITDKVFRKRKSVHAVSLMGQHICFWAEFLHLLIVYLIRLIGERYIGIDALELTVINQMGSYISIKDSGKFSWFLAEGEGDFG